MSKIGVNLKIDVSKIDKTRLFKGQKGTYLDATVFIDLDQLDQYGNSGMITQDVSKEEKSQGLKGAILGNCKKFWSGEGLQQQAPMQTNQYQSPEMQSAVNNHNANLNQQQNGGFNDDFSDDIPF